MQRYKKTKPKSGYIIDLQAHIIVRVVIKQALLKADLPR